MKVKVVAVGGAGRNILNALIELGLDRDCALNIDADINAKAASRAPFLQIGGSVCNGHGSVEPCVGLVAAKESENEIAKELRSAEALILVAGLGGGTGAGALPFVASLASAKTVAVAVMPAIIEGKRRMARAEEALVNLKAALGEESVHAVEMAPGAIATMFDNTDKLVAERVLTLLKKYKEN